MANLILSTTESINQTQDQTFTIPGMTKFNSVTANTGIVTVVNVSGNQIAVRVINGTKTKTEQTGGGYTPSDSKTVTNQASSNYNSGGYSGTLTRYLYSGSYTPADSKTVSVQSTHSRSTQYIRTSSGWSIMYDNGPAPSTMSYNSGGYSGTLTTGGTGATNVRYEGDTNSTTIGASYWHFRDFNNTYTGTVTKPAVDTEVYRYKGTVTKPAVDTRTYTDYYQYSLTFDYETNIIPTLTLSTTNNLILNENDTFVIDGQAIDSDIGNVVNVKYQINDNTVQIITSNTSDGTTQIPFSKTLTFKGGKLYDGINTVTVALLEGISYTLKVWSEDNQGGKSTEVIRNFTVIPVVKNRRNPSISVNNKNEVFVVYENYYNTNDIDIGMFKKSNDKWIDKDILTSGAKETTPSTLDDKTLDFDVPPFIYKHDTKVGFYGIYSGNTKPSKANIVGIPTNVNPRDKVNISTSGSIDTYNDNLTYFYEFFDGTVWREIATNKGINETVTHIIPQIIGGTSIAKYRIRSFNGRLFSDYTTSNDFTVNIGPSDIIIKDNTVIDQPYDTNGNGGKKIINVHGVKVSVAKKGTDGWIMYVSLDGITWTSRHSVLNNTITDVAIIANPIKNQFYLISTMNTTSVRVYSYDINIETGDTTYIGEKEIDNAQTALGNVSLVINEAGTELHATWASKNVTYANSFNIRYIKGEINPDGNIMWGTVEQWTTYSLATTYAKNPTVVVNSLNEPLVISEIKTNEGYFIVCIGKAGIALDSNIKKEYSIVEFGDTHIQSYPTAIYVPKSVNKLPNGRILVAYHGTDVSNPTIDSIQLRYSDDNGSNWKRMKI